MNTATAIIIGLIVLVLLLLILSVQSSCNQTQIKRIKQELEISVLHDE